MTKSKTRNIYYLCSSDKTIAGGVKKAYQHVDILNTLGYSAYILHIEMGFRYNWFQNNTPLAYVERLDGPITIYDKNNHPSLYPPISKYDLLVLPENTAYTLAPHLLALGLCFVIFNQNAYLTFFHEKQKQHPFSATRGKEQLEPYYNKNLLGTLVVSEDSLNYMKFGFPHLDNLYRIHLSIDFNLFSYQPKKKKQIAYMTRKRNTHSTQVTSLLRERNTLIDWTFVPIDNMTEYQVAEILKESALFLSFCKTEGSPLTLLEAMSCGCLVIGYHGQGGKEILKKPYGYPINDSEIVTFAKTAESIILDYNHNIHYYFEKARLASEFVQHTFSNAHETADLKKAWTSVIKNHERCLREY